uniref:Uncharacterized protein n=1 Tax=Sphaerodactylus townsendi TaxID=933632 RepID=A0ACB8EQT1_9SAUR
MLTAHFRNNTGQLQQKFCFQSNTQVFLRQLLFVNFDMEKIMQVTLEFKNIQHIKQKPLFLIKNLSEVKLANEFCCILHSLFIDATGRQCFRKICVTSLLKYKSVQYKKVLLSVYVLPTPKSTQNCKGTRVDS